MDPRIALSVALSSLFVIAGSWPLETPAENQHQQGMSGCVFFPYRYHFRKRLLKYLNRNKFRG